MDRPPFSRAVLRAFALRCPRCGSGHLFRHWLTMVADCPRCGLHFEREQGYWLGSMTINLAVTMGLFMVVLVAGMAFTWPDVPWTALWIATVGVTLVTPLVIHPWSRTVWVAVERQVRSMSDGVY